MTGKHNQHNKLRATSLLGRLLANENFRVTYGQFETAAIDLQNRNIFMPILKEEYSQEVRSMLVAHEVSHALHTPPEGFHDVDVNIKDIPKSYLNIVEDIRIETLIRRKYPGLIFTFSKGYKELWENEFFGIGPNELDLFNQQAGFPDRLNIHSKTLGTVPITFNDEEQPLVDEAMGVETWDDVIEVCRKIKKYVDKQPQRAGSNSTQQQQGKGDGNESWDPTKQGTGDTDRSGEEGNTEESDAGTPSGSSHDSSGGGKERRNQSPSESDQSDDNDGNGDSEAESGMSSSECGDNGAGKRADPVSAGSDGSAESDDHEGGTSGDGSAESTGDSSTDQDSEQNADESETKAEPHNHLDWSTRGDLGGKPNTLGSVTDASHRANEKNMVDFNTTIIRYEDGDYGVTPLQNIVDKFHRSSAAHIDINLAYRTIRARNDRYVNAMVREFNMRKAARDAMYVQHRRTGMLDERRLHEYRTTDDIFMHIDIVPEGKNHAFVMMIDYSYSMNSSIIDVFNQVFIFSEFCNRLEIPYKVLTFTNGRTNVPVNDIQRINLHEVIPKSHKHFMNRIWDNQCLVINTILDSASPVNRRALQYLAAVIDEKIDSEAGYGSMSGTPLCDAVLASFIEILKMKDATQAERLHCILMTDGSGSDWLAANAHHITADHNDLSVVYKDNQYTTTAGAPDHTRALMQLIRQHAQFSHIHLSNGPKDVYPSRLCGHDDVEFQNVWQGRGYYHNTKADWADDSYVIPLNPEKWAPDAALVPSRATQIAGRMGQKIA